MRHVSNSHLVLSHYFFIFFRYFKHLFFFFFQAEDGIRDELVTGVQTCALPISARCSRSLCRGGAWKPERASLCSRRASCSRRTTMSSRIWCGLATSAVPWLWTRRGITGSLLSL